MQHVALLFRSTVILVIFTLVPSLAQAIETPRDTRGTVLGSEEIKWEWRAVPGATRYQVDVNGVFVQYVEGTSYRSTGLSDGDYWFTVQAVDNNNVHSHRSERSATVTIGAGSSNVELRSNQNNENNQATNVSADIPGNVQGTQIGESSARFGWNRVIGAQSYVIYVNGDGQNPLQTNDENIVLDNLSNGEHQIKVAAIDASTGRHSDQSAGAVVNINGDFSNTGGDNGNTGNNNVAPPPPENDNGPIDPTSYNYNLKPGYNLVFSDEFNANTLNRNRWNTQLRWDGSWNGERYEYRLINGESQIYSNIYSADQEHLDKVASMHNPFEFNGERLAIRAKVNPAYDANDPYNAYGPLDSIYKQQPFISGVISSYDKFSGQFGYVEARIKVPAHMGTFPAWWMHHQRRENEGTQKTEIDIMENLGHNPHYVYGSFHYFDNVSEFYGGDGHFIKPKPEGQIDSRKSPFNIPNFSDDYHVYAVDWKPGGIIDYYIDGQKVSEVRHGAADHEPLYLILNMAIGGTWINGPSNSGGSGRSFPTQQDIDTWGNPALEIDYVRVYKPQ